MNATSKKKGLGQPAADSKKKWVKPEMEKIVLKSGTSDFTNETYNAFFDPSGPDNGSGG